MAKRKRADRIPPYFFYTCPGCEKRGSVMFLLESLPYDFTCSACGMPTHLCRNNGEIILTFDHPDWAAVDDPTSPQADEAGGACPHTGSDGTRPPLWAGRTGEDGKNIPRR